ncbi:creB [Candida oxycetoniae]|uniref:Ubiquitin carboxyl-terminal hydrolase n=1 Tax=Candida oxycetoniae TaxID=497107 RepID=A0AAI9STM9_9ASCO|nr:creB [Candida oxycetoniae]KAI3402426.2 creB [Candida oxycetoniae]
MSASNDSLPFGDGASKIFGMENFGNTCYCNSILQCLYYTESFRKSLVQHKQTKHEPKLVVNGVKFHGFTAKYDQLLQKKLKEQGNVPSINSEERPKSSRKSSLFGLKFNNSTNVASTVVEEETNNNNKFIEKAGVCEALPLEQRILISKNPEFWKLDVLITRPTLNQAQAAAAAKAGNVSNTTEVGNGNGGLVINSSGSTMDYSQSSSMLLNDQPLQTTQEGTVNTKSSAIIVGIPKPEANLVNPINAFSVNPNADQRKRSALINGPIINLDTSLQLPNDQREETVLLYALKDMFESMIENKSTIGVVSPNYFITKLKEKNYLFKQNNMHHDAHEFFNYLINEIIESINRELGPSANWCNNIFQGLITNETKCLSCETVTSKHEHFLDLSIDIPSGDSAYSLNFSLNNFSKSETLTNQNKFHCNTCSSLQEAVKTIKIKKLPEVLVINLKRFKYDEKIGKMVKLFDSISYPFKLRLFNTTDDFHDNVLYDLYALVIHIGGGPMHGHYVSICKIKAGLWLLFDDETVELVEDNYVMRFFGNGPGLASAYILFYQKLQFDESAEYLGFDPTTMYNGEEFDVSIRNGNGTVSTTDQESKTTTTGSANDVDTRSDLSSLNSFTGPNETKKPTSSSSDVFKSFRFEKNDDKGAQSSLSRRSSGNDIATLNQENVKEVKEKKSWIGSFKRTTLEKKQSLVSGASKSELDTGNSSGVAQTIPPPPLEKRRSLFGFKKKS